MIPYKIISSGSKGNAVIINDFYLIDCGVSRKALAPFMDRISIVFLTHRHSDHFRASTIRAISESRPTVRFACCSWLVPDLLMAGVPQKNIDVLTPGGTFHYSTMHVEPFAVTHDVPNCGYKLHFLNGNVFYATDCANLNGISAKGYELYMIEANHKTAEIEQKIQEKKAAGEYSYEIRAQEMHLSEEDANDWLYKNMAPHSNYIFMHVHHDKGD